MSLRHPIPWLALGLGLLAASTAARVVELPALSIEPSRTKRAHLGADQRERLDALFEADTHASIEYWVTPEAALPPDLRGLEPAVRAAFDALRAAHPDRLRLSVHHPRDAADLEGHLATLGVRATRAPRIEDDRWAESELTSSLRFTLGSHAAVVRNGLLPAHTTDIPELLLAHLEDLAHPSRPRVLLDAPGGFVAFESLLADRADVQRAELSTASPGERADLIVWLQPASASPEALARIEAHLAGGGDLLLAGSATSSALGRDQEMVVVQLTPAPAFARALGALGVRTSDGVLLDPISDALPLPDGSHIAAHHLASIPAPNQDFRALAGQPDGSLLFDAPTALDLDPNRLAARGLRAEVLATASPRAVVVTPPAAPLSLAALSDLAGAPAPRAPVAALLTSTDPSRGRVLLLGSASPLADAHLGDERFRHLALVRILLDTLTSRDRLLLRRAATNLPPVLPPLSTSERTRIRLFLVLGIPLLLSAAFFFRRDRAPEARLAPRLAPLGAVFAVPVAASLLLSPLAGLGHDATADHRHHLDAGSEAFLSGALSDIGHPVLVELWSPPRAEMPVELAAALDRARQRLSELCAALGMEFRERSGDAQEAAAALELEPRTLSDSLTEERHALEVCVGARIKTSDGRALTLDLSDVATHERLRFRLALGLRTLHRGAPPKIAVASDRPLLSPAEAVLDYQNHGHFVPGGADPYAAARAWLTAHGFDLAHIDSAEPVLPRDVDAVLLFQPRRNADALYRVLFEHLHSGGRALVCAQQHDVLARRLRENDHAFAYWPRPLYSDLDAPPFSELGLTLDTRLLFDARHGTALVPARVDRPGRTPHTELAPTSEAFCVRVLGSDAHGDLVLAGANALAWDPDRLAERGLLLTPWLHASPGAWSHAWEGGDLTPAALSGDLTDSANARFDAPALLAADLEGIFPSAGKSPEGLLVLVDAPLMGSEQPDELVGSDPSVPGRWTLMGSSAPFRAAHLHAPGTDHAQLLLHAVARLTLEPELVRMSNHREAPVGFEPPSASVRLSWRLFLLGCAPLLLACVGLRRVRGRA